jgi:very-short-patch-repair endonuclease
MRMTYRKRDFARRLRKEQTPAEEKVWQMLRNNQCLGLKFRRQHVVEGFVVDFYCDQHKLAIEIDGGVHDKKFTKQYDQLRQIELESKDVTFIRIKNSEIEKDPNILLKRIKAVLRPLPLGEGRKRTVADMKQLGEGCV